ncbi:MAG: hypothetical protein HY908_21685 [Myxococcales bacterium]|nr:hypothetical protein [Myxococcales bacterium]
MLPWKKLDTAREPGGRELSLWQRADEYAIRVDGQSLMGSTRSASEVALGVRGCAGVASARAPRVLVGGLGMGFTLRAALDTSPPDARVDVAELVPAVVAWNRGPLAHLAGRPLDDPRVTVLERDVGTVLREADGTYDAVLLDVDNGPAALTARSNRGLYDAAGIARVARALRPGGVLAVWSVSDDAAFTARLVRGGLRARTERVPKGASGRGRHTLWLAVRAR